MNRMISFAKIMFAGLGIYLSIGIVNGILTAIVFLFRGETKWDSVGIVTSSVCLSLAMFVAVIYVLIVKRDKWAHKLIAKEIEPNEPLDVDLTLTMAFRLVSVGVGLLCLRSFLWVVSSNVRTVIRALNYAPKDERTRQLFSGGFSIDYVLPSLYLALAIYLLCGAPHFVRWQVKKTLQFCDKNK